MINIIKSGVGNIGSLIKVINDLEYSYKIISNPDDFTNTKKIILPGVGSFDSFINSLRNQNLFEKRRRLCGRAIVQRPWLWYIYVPKS